MNAPAPAPVRTGFTKAELRDLGIVSRKLLGMGVLHRWTTGYAGDGSARAVFTAGAGYRLLSITKYGDRHGFYLATGDGHDGACIPQLTDILNERVTMS